MRFAALIIAWIISPMLPRGAIGTTGAGATGRRGLGAPLVPLGFWPPLGVGEPGAGACAGGAGGDGAPPGASEGPRSSWRPSGTLSRAARAVALRRGLVFAFGRGAASVA